MSKIVSKLQRRKEIVWSSKLAYAIGLIATDGCLSNDGRHLTLVSKDLEQVQNLKRCLGLKVKIGRHTSGKQTGRNICHRIQWGDVILYRLLQQIGLEPNKSKTMPALSIPGEYFFDFLRGHFDGDGTFYSYFDPRWKNSFLFYVVFLSASKDHVLWLQSELNKRLGLTGHIVASKNFNRENTPIFSLRFGKKDSLQVLHSMYADPMTVCLSRKRLKILRALRIVGESLSKTARDNAQVVKLADTHP